MPPKKDLGSILVDEDVLDAKALERAVSANAGRRPLWAALIEAEVADAEQRFYERQRGRFELGQAEPADPATVGNRAHRNIPRARSVMV